MKAALALSVLLLLGTASCVSETGPLDKLRCTEQSDCAEGQVCYLGFCDPDTDADAGDGDVSAGDATE